MPFKATLKIVLKADETVVAESEDPVLWQNILLAINSNSSTIIHRDSNPDVSKDQNIKENIGIDPIDKFANEIGVDKNILIGACSPTNEKPFIHLDKHHWEALKKNLPSKGSNAIAAAAIGGTILVLWKDAAKLGDTLQKDVAGVLNTIGIKDKNPKRSFDNCKWLQLRNDKLMINPAETSKAIDLVKSYCLKSIPESYSE